MRLPVQVQQLRPDAPGAATRWSPTALDRIQHREPSTGQPRYPLRQMPGDVQRNHAWPRINAVVEAQRNGLAGYVWHLCDGCLTACLVLGRFSSLLLLLHSSLLSNDSSFATR